MKLKRRLVIGCLLGIALAKTPNLRLTLPAHGALDWDTKMNGNFSIIDGIFVSGACRDATHALSWSPTPKTLGCQAISGLAAGVANGSALVSSGVSQPVVYQSKPVMVYQSKPVIDVRDYGAVCNGLADDTAALNAAIAVASGSGWNGSSWGNPTRSAKIMLPIGNCTTTTGLTYNGGLDYSIEIAGQNSSAAYTATTLTYTGASGGTGIRLNAAVRSKVDNLTVSCSSCLYGINIDSYNVTETGYPPAHDDKVEDVTVFMGSVANSAALAFGHVGCSGEQISDIEIDNPYLGGVGTTTTSGIVNFCGNNNKNYTVKGGSIIAFGTGINGQATIGAFDVYHTIFLNNTVASINPSAGPAVWHLNGIRAEGDARFIYPGTITFPSSMSIVNSYWSGATPSDDVCIQFQGSLVLSGNYIRNLRTGSTRCIIVSDGAQGPSLRSDHNWFVNADEVSNCVFYDAVGGNVINDKCGSQYYQYFGLNTDFVSEGDWGGTTRALIPLSGSDQLRKDFFANTVRQSGTTSNYPPHSGCFLCLLNTAVILSENNALNGTVNWLSKNSSDVLVVGGSAGATFSGQISSTLSAGTAPFSITSTTPVANLTVSNHPTLADCGSTTTCAKTQETSALIVRGSVAFPTASTVTVTSLPFTSASTYSCTAGDATTAAGIVNATTYTSGSSVTFTETKGVNTDTMRYICVGY